MLPDTIQILTLADEYLRVEGLRETALSNRLFNESKKLSLLRGGTDVTLSRYRMALQWFSEHWPDDAVWPEAVPRPEVSA